MIRRKKSNKVKVTLRFKLLDTGRESLYLDYYPAITDPDTGNPTRREFLQMHVTPFRRLSSAGACFSLPERGTMNLLKK
jgi:hypothetical protein